MFLDSRKNIFILYTLLLFGFLIPCFLIKKLFYLEVKMKNQIHVIAFGLIFLLSALFIFLIHSENQRNSMQREINSLKSSNQILIDHLGLFSSVISEE